jgi:rare lipoprotein A
MMPWLARFGHGSALIGFRSWGGSNLGGGTDWGCEMSPCCAKRLYVAVTTNPVPDAPLVAAARVRKLLQRLAVVLAAASLAACAQSSVVTRNSEFVGSSRQASLPHDRTAAFTVNRRVASAKTHTPFAAHGSAAGTKIASQGIASFYTEGTLTASGEKFDTHELTAAHPTLPFGTKLRVTNVATGRSVTVRINDRGPYVPGRVVDVSYSAADALGMVGKGVANVKLDVVQ